MLEREGTKHQSNKKNNGHYDHFKSGFLTGFGIQKASTKLTTLICLTLRRQPKGKSRGHHLPKILAKIPANKWLSLCGKQGTYLNILWSGYHCTKWRCHIPQEKFTFFGERGWNPARGNSRDWQVKPQG